MRAAQILAEMLLDEAAPGAPGAPAPARKVVAIIYGQGIPQSGWWVSGATEEEVLGKMTKNMRMPSTASVGQMVDTLISRGYTVVMPDTAGEIAVYGNGQPDLDAQSMKILGVQPGTPTHQLKGYHGHPSTTTARQALGVGATPKELSHRANQRNQGKPFMTSPNMSAADQADYRKWALKKYGSKKAGFGILP